MTRRAYLPGDAEDVAPIAPDPYSTCALCGSWHYTHRKRQEQERSWGLPGCPGFRAETPPSHSPMGPSGER